MRFHHGPDSAGNSQLAYIVHIANYLAIQSGLGTGPAFDSEPLSDGALDALTLKETDLEEISAEMLSAVEQISASLQV